MPQPPPAEQEFDPLKLLHTVPPEELWSRYFETPRAGEEVRRIEEERPVDYWQTTMRYTITNAKPVPVNVDLVQAGMDQGWWSRDYRIVSEDEPGKQLNSDRRKWIVPVPANGKREFRVTYASRY